MGKALGSILAASKQLLKKALETSLVTIAVQEEPAVPLMLSNLTLGLEHTLPACTDSQLLQQGLAAHL